MKNTKKISVVLCTCLAVILMFGGWSTAFASAGEKEPVTISLSYCYAEEYIRDVLDAFEEAYPYINVEYRYSSESEDEFFIKVAAHQAEDVCQVLTNNLKVSEMKDYYLPMGDSKELAEKYYYGDYLDYEGQSYGLPTGIVYEGLLYNQAILDQYYGGKVPTTLDELYECCEILAQNGIIPFWSNAGSGWPIRYWDNLAITMSENPDYANTIITTKNPWGEGSYLRQAENILATLAANGWLEKDVVTANQWDTSCASIASGKTCFIITGSWAISYIQKAVTELGGDPSNIGFTAFPYKNDVSADNPLNLRLTQDLFIGVSSSTEHPEEAKLLATFWAEYVSPYIGENGIVIDGGTVMDTVKNLSEVDYIKMYTSPARSETISDMAAKCEIDVYANDSFLLEYVVLPCQEAGSIDAARYDDLNALWATNF